MIETNVDKIYHGNDQVALLRQDGQVIWPQYAGHENLVLWYDAMGKTNADLGRGILEDLSGNGNHGSLQNFAYTDESGYDDGLVFDGVDDYVDAGNSANVDVSGEITVEVLFKLNAVSTGYEWIVMKGNNSNVNTGYGVFIVPTTGRPLIIRASGYDISIPFSPNIGDFYHIQLTISANEGGKVFVNGELKGVNVNMKSVISNNIRLTLGRAAYYSSPYFKSKYYVNRIYNRALTPQEIQQNYLIDKARWIDSYDPSTVAVLNYADKMGYTRASKPYIDAMDVGIKSLKQKGIWAKNDVLFNFKGDGDLNFKCINLINPEKSATPYGGLINTLEGIEGNGIDGYVDTNFNPTIGVNEYTLNDAHRMAWVYKVHSGSGASTATSTIDGVRINVSINIMLGISSLAQRINQSTVSNSISADISGLGFKSINRSDSDNIIIINNGIEAIVESLSTSVYSNNQVLLSRGATGLGPVCGDSGISFYSMGSSITGQLAQDYKQILEEW